MLSERDKSVVDAYARTGMSLETLIASFPKFDKADVEAIYNNLHNEKPYEEPQSGISINCS